MIIDSHTHIYPDKIARKVEEVASSAFGTRLYGSMTTSGLLSTMERLGITGAFAFCVAERPEVVRPANDFIISISDDRRLFGLGTLHPRFEGWKEEIQRLRKAGIRGIKFHSLFQDFDCDEERMMEIYEEMGRDMVAYFHSGLDPRAPGGEARTSPERLARVIDTFPGLKVVAAHLGGLEMLEEVRKHLLGKDIYIDLAWVPSLEALNPREVARLIQEHGPHQVLFATDYPMTDTARQLEYVMRLPLREEEMELILGRNALRLLGLERG
jgi:hypothetical protein